MAGLTAAQWIIRCILDRLFSSSSGPSLKGSRWPLDVCITLCSLLKWKAFESLAPGVEELRLKEENLEGRALMRSIVTGSYSCEYELMS